MSDYWQAFTREQTDRQYNPTLWTRRLPTDDLLPTHIALTNERSESYRAGLGEGMQTVEFGNGDFAGSMDVFRPAGVADDAPIVVYIHGGWWQWFSNEQFSFLAEPFNARGMAVYMPGYRLAQDWDNDRPMESIVAQMEQAVAAVLLEAAKRGSSGVYLVGHSAGGHLVALLRETDWERYGLSRDVQGLLKGVFSLAGLFDIRPLVDSFINDEIRMSEASASAVSPYLKQVAGRPLCPLHLLVPEFDTPEFFRQTKEYQDKLLAAGQSCRFHLANDRDHLDIIENLVNEDDEVLAYLLRHIDRNCGNQAT